MAFYILKGYNHDVTVYVAATAVCTRPTQPAELGLGLPNSYREVKRRLYTDLVTA